MPVSKPLTLIPPGYTVRELEILLQRCSRDAVANANMGRRIGGSLMQSVQDDPLLTTRDLAEYFQVKPETIRDWIKTGKLQAVKIGRSYRVYRSVARAYAKGIYDL